MRFVSSNQSTFRCFPWSIKAQNCIGWPSLDRPLCIPCELWLIHKIPKKSSWHFPYDYASLFNLVAIVTSWHQHGISPMIMHPNSKSNQWQQCSKRRKQQIKNQQEQNLRLRTHLEETVRSADTKIQSVLFSHEHYGKSKNLVRSCVKNHWRHFSAMYLRQIPNSKHWICTQFTQKTCLSGEMQL